MLTPAIRSNVPNRGGAGRWKYRAFLRTSAGGEMGPRFRGDDKLGVDDFPWTALRFRGDDKLVPW